MQTVAVKYVKATSEQDFEEIDRLVLELRQRLSLESQAVSVVEDAAARPPRRTVVALIGHALRRP